MHCKILTHARSKTSFLRKQESCVTCFEESIQYALQDPYSRPLHNVIPAKAGGTLWVILRNMLRGINSICTARSLLTPACVMGLKLSLSIRAVGQG